MLEYYCKYKCDKTEIESNIIDMLSGEIYDVSVCGNVCDICMVKDFIREIRDEF